MGQTGARGASRGDKGANKVSYGACRVLGCKEPRYGRRLFCRKHSNTPTYPDKPFIFELDGVKWVSIKDHPIGDSCSRLKYARYLIYEQDGDRARCNDCGLNICWDENLSSSFIEGEPVVICWSCTNIQSGKKQRPIIKSLRICGYKISVNDEFGENVRAHRMWNP